MSDNNSDTQKVEDGQVVTLDYTLRVDGQVVDSSEGQQPIQFIQGKQQIIPGLESELYGMTVGDEKEVVVQAEQGYGEVDPENFLEVPRDQFPPDIPLQPDVELELRDQNGQQLQARIAKVADQTVTLDFNHPLAGKELHFWVNVIDLRNATNEEMNHGHVHGEDHDEKDE